MKDENSWILGWPKEQPQPQPQPQVEEEDKGEADPHAQRQKETNIEFIADIVDTPSPSATPPGTLKHSPQPRDEAERGMHRYTPLHDGTCYMVLFVHFSLSLVYSKNGAQEEGLGGETLFARRRVGATRRGCTQDPGGGCATKRARYLRVGITCLLVLFFMNFAFFGVLVCPFFLPHICLFACSRRKRADELIRRMKERWEAEEREEEEERKKSGMCLSHPPCCPVTMAHYGSIYV